MTSSRSSRSSDSFFLRPSLGGAASLGGGTAAYFDGRIDACLRVPGNYVEHRGLLLDTCAGTELAGLYHVPASVGGAPGPATTDAIFAISPTIGLRGDLASDLAVEVRGLADFNIAPHWRHDRIALGPRRGRIDMEGALNASDFRSLYDDHVAFVWRNLRRLGVAPSDVEDRVQEVFVVAHRRLADYEERGHGPRAWLFQIVLRVASEWRRHKRRHPEDADGGVAQDLGHTEPEQTDLLARRERSTSSTPRSARSTSTSARCSCSTRSRR